MLDTLRLKTLLGQLRKRLVELETTFKPLPEAKFISDETLYNAAEHHLQIAIQSCLDIAAHIVAALGLPMPEKEASEVFLTLNKEGIISQKLASIMKQIVGYRNIVVHEYLKVDRHITYRNIQSGISDLSLFGQEIEKFLEKFAKSS